MGLSVAAIGGVVSAIAKYLAVSKVTEKALEQAGEAGGEALVGVGKEALGRLRQVLGGRDESAQKAVKALADIEEDPDDEDYQGKLTKELTNLAADDEELRGLLARLSQAVLAFTGGVRGEVNVYGGKVDQAVGVSVGEIVYHAGGTATERRSTAEPTAGPSAAPDTITEPSAIPILAVFAGARDEARLDLLREVKVLQESLEVHGERFDLRLLPAGTVDDLSRALLSHHPQVLHFSGHGEAGGLLFEAGDGTSHLVPREALVRELRLHAPPLKCVILNACFSASHSADLTLGVPHVIAMRGPIDDAAAIEFARGFYEAFAEGEEVPKAYDLGCNRIRLKNLPDADVPVLAASALGPPES